MHLRREWVLGRAKTLKGAEQKKCGCIPTHQRYIRALRGYMVCFVLSSRLTDIIHHRTVIIIIIDNL